MPPVCAIGIGTRTKTKINRLTNQSGSPHRFRRPLDRSIAHIAYGGMWSFRPFHLAPTINQHHAPDDAGFVVPLGRRHCGQQRAPHGRGWGAEHPVWWALPPVVVAVLLLPRTIVMTRGRLEEETRHAAARGKARPLLAMVDRADAAAVAPSSCCCCCSWCSAAARRRREQQPLLQPTAGGGTAAAAAAACYPGASCPCPPPWRSRRPKEGGAA